ncbi:AAA family ATPase [Candidatus Saccharibacteria bacterium]|nr:AAA family ATPase [Candidatus Saccharibacteria bacterium]
MKVVGIAGTNGSGKDTVGRVLSEKHGYLWVSVSDILRDECRRRGLPVERESLRAISAEWRRVGGLGVLVDKAVEALSRSKREYKGLAVGSLRNPGEIDRIHELHGLAVWVDAAPRVRYERIQRANRGRGSEDDITFEQFLSEEAAEMSHSGDEATLNMSAVKAACDKTLNNENGEAELEQAIEELLA